MDDEDLNFDTNFSTPDTALNGVIGADTSSGLGYDSALTAALTSPISAPISTPVTSLISTSASGLATIGNSIANIFRATNPNPTAGYYNAAGQFVPIVAPRNPAVGGSSIATTGGNVVSFISSLLPLIIIVAILGFVISLFGHKRK